MSRQQPFTLRGYHGDNSNPAVRRPDRSKLSANHIGIELEVVSRSATVASVLDTLPFPRHSKHRPLTEEDGSLPDGGVEIIFPPFSASTIKRADSYFSKVLDAIKPAVRDRHHSAGMHFNVSLLSTPLANTEFTCVLNNLPPQLYADIFGRGPTSYYSRTIRGETNNFYGWGNLTLRNNHHIAVTYRGSHSDRAPNYIEVRLAASTVEHSQVKVIIKLLELVREFAESREPNPAILTNSSGAFRDWLRANKRCTVSKKILSYY